MSGVFSFFGSVVSIPTVKSRHAEDQQGNQAKVFPGPKVLFDLFLKVKLRDLGGQYLEREKDDRKREERNHASPVQNSPPLWLIVHE